MALTYDNGYVPTKLLVTFKTGYTPGEGDWAHMTTPSSYAKHLALVALAKANTGRTLEITDGWGAYRPYESQVYARSLYGNGAAWPGTSSHGMFWEGRQCAAYDYGNWSWVYNGDRAAFYRDVRAVGMEPGLIHPSRGNNYPDEPWHVVDLDPWAPVTAGGKSGTPATIIIPEEDEMKPDSMFAIVDGVPSWCWLNWGTGSLYAVHNQKDANWIGAYMGSVKDNFSRAVVNGAPVADGGGDLYKNKLALFGILCPKVKIEGASLTPTDLARIQALVSAGNATRTA